MSFLERHKPIFTILLAILLVAAIGGVFYVLREHEEEEDLSSINLVVDDTLDDFADALKEGDMKTAKKYCSKEGAEQLLLSSMSTEKFKTTLLEGLGVTEDDLGEDSKMYLQSLLDTLKTKAVVDVKYDSDDVEVEKKSDEGFVVTIPVTINGCGSFHTMDFSAEISFANHSMLDYAAANQDALMNHNDAFGAEGVHGLLAQQAYTNLFSSMAAKAAAYEPSDREYKFTLLVTKDSSGEFSDAEIISAEEILE